MASVTLRKVTKKFGNLVVVDQIDLEIKDKEFLVLVGPSGCGKSTTLRMVAGLEEITSGEILIGDAVVNNVAPKDRNIAMVFQNYALYPHMNVFANMAFGLKLRHVSKGEIERRVKEAAQILGIDHLLQRKPKELSGGQRQRVALGRAIVRNPQVFLMDEPLSNLDAKLRVQMRTELAKIHQRLQTTIIYVTHDQTEAMTMGNRIVVMKDGRIQQVATPQEVYDNPANMFVAGFIGSPAMNFISCRVVEEEKGLILTNQQGFRITVPADKAAALQPYKNKEIIFGIRPEHISYAKQTAGGDSNIIRTMVEVVEPMGSELYVYVNIGEVHLTVRLPYKFQVKVGSSMDIAFDLTKMHIFDKETGETII